MTDSLSPRSLIGIVVPTTDNAFFSNLAVHAESWLYEAGYASLICSSANSAERERQYLQALASVHVRGILCVSGLSALPEGLLPEDLPLVWMDRHPVSARTVPCVANDDRAAMKEATEYLIDQGCRNILLMPGYLAETRTSPRVIGYEEALKARGIPLNTAYILNRIGKRPSETETEELVRGVVQEGLPVDGMITSSDRAAFGAITALHKVGLYVPEDVKLISFDNSPYSTMSSPAITALDRNPRELAETACACLLRQIRGESVPEQVTIPVRLCKRDSTR